MLDAYKDGAVTARCLDHSAHRPPALPSAAGNEPIVAMELLASPAWLRLGYVVWPE